MHNKKLVNSLMVLLVLQFILGISANLYSKIPGDMPYEVFHQFGFIAFHAVNAIVLLILSIILLIQSIKHKVFKSAAGAGLFGIMLAFVCGEGFVFTQHAVYSLLMAIGFIVAFMSYARMAFSNSAPTPKS